MTIIEQIKAKIERLKDENNNIRCDSNKAYCQGYGDAFVDLLPFLDTIEKPVPADLEEAAEEYTKGYFDNCSSAKRAADHGFIAGAKWQKEQMMEEAVEGVVYRYESYQRIATAIVVDINRELLGNKVNVIILPKEDEK